MTLHLKEYFMKSSSASRKCILCSAIDSKGAIVQEIFTASSWNIKI